MFTCATTATHPKARNAGATGAAAAAATLVEAGGDKTAAAAASSSSVKASSRRSSLEAGSAPGAREQRGGMAADSMGGGLREKGIKEQARDRYGLDYHRGYGKPKKTQGQERVG